MLIVLRITVLRYPQVKRSRSSCAGGAKTVLFTEAVLNFLLPRLVKETVDLSEDSQGTITMVENHMSWEQTNTLRYAIILSRGW